MTKQATTATPVKANPITRLQEYYHEVMAEVGKVSWPGKEEIKASTWIVATLLIIIGAIIFLFDVVFQRGILLLLMLG